MNKFNKVIFTFFLVLILSGCIAFMSNEPLAVPGQNDTYQFSITVNSYAASETAFEKVKYEIEIFQIKNKYISHRILDIKHTTFHPYEYIVRFTRD
jgi:PBP1b-binding outer membrane lipoprotein LpoB